MPPLCITRPEVDELVEILALGAEEAIREVEARRAARKAQG